MTGVDELVFVALPSWPTLFVPQQAIPSPSSVMAQECRKPAATRENLSCVTTTAGVGW